MRPSLLYYLNRLSAILKPPVADITALRRAGLCAVLLAAPAWLGGAEPQPATAPATPQPAAEALSNPPVPTESSSPPDPPAQTAPPPAASPLPVEQSRPPSWTHRIVVTSGSIIGHGLLSAAWGEAFHRPREWETSAEGFGWRLASSVGRRAVSKGIEFAVTELDGERNLACRSPHNTLLGRLGDALAGGVTTTGYDWGRTVAWSRIAGAFGSATVARLWYPDSQRSFGYVLRSGGTSLAIGTALSVVKEFRPGARANLPPCPRTRYPRK